MPSGEDRIRSTQDEVWDFQLNLHAAQRTIFDSPARFKIAAAGRRFGKTMLAATMAIVEAASKPDAEVMWVSPSHSQSREAMRWIGHQIPKQHREINNTQGTISLSSGGRISFRSAERYDNIRGVGLDFVVIDEAAFVEMEVWTKVLRPALSDRRGRAFLISTFDGENWFYDVWRAAQMPDNPSWEAFEFWTKDSPFVSDEEIEDARRSMPKEEFEQEFECSPISFKGAVFNGAELAAGYERGVEMQAFPEGYPHFAGVDWGWVDTSLEVCAEFKNGDIAWVHEQVYDRMELQERCDHIAVACRDLNVQIVYTDAADPSANHTLAKTLKRFLLKTFVQPVPFNAYKMIGVRARAVYIMQGRETITPNCPALYRDSRAYKIDPVTDKPAKGNDHTVDAATAFYASRMDVLGTIPEVPEDLNMEDDDDEPA
jgi:hypothetical protein